MATRRIDSAGAEQPTNSGFKSVQSYGFDERKLLQCRGAGLHTLALEQAPSLRSLKLTHTLRLTKGPEGHIVTETATFRRPNGGPLMGKRS